MNPSQLYRKINAIDTDAIVNLSLDNTMDKLTGVNKERMSEGLRADNSVHPNYSFISQVVYGYPDAPFRMKATGAFQAGMFAQRSGDVVVTSSKDSKTDMLEKKFAVPYGTSLFGVQGEFKKQYLDDALKPEFTSNMKKATGLPFKKR